MPLVVVGLSHRTAPIEIRERLALSRAELPGVLRQLVESGAATEAVVLSTCNRTEIYLSLFAEPQGVRAAHRLLSGRLDEAPAAVADRLYLHRDRAAAEHLFRVTAGLDSMVLGEAQIQGQVKDAYAAARETMSEAGPIAGSALHRLFQTALSVGGRIRSETEVGRGSASVSSAGVELAKKIFGSLRGRRVLVLGAGEMAQITLECLRAEGVRSAKVASRTLERAEEVARRCGAEAIEMEDVWRELAEVEIVISSTAAPHTLITRERFRAAVPGGRRRPLCIIDLAIPRDVEPEVGKEPSVFLYNLDDLTKIVDGSLERRRTELPRAEEIVTEGVADFWGWYSGLAVVPTIRDLRDRGEQLREAELARTLRRLSHLPAEDRAAIEGMSRSLTNKLLHAPTSRLRDAAGNGRGTAVLDAVRYLFELDRDSTD